jgi:hypothetical protein
MYQNFFSPYLYEAQHVSGDTQPIIRSLKLHWQPLVLRSIYRERLWDVWFLDIVTSSTHTSHNLPRYILWKTRGCQCSFRLLMMGVVSPKTCWVSYKYGLLKIWYIVTSCWICYELASSCLSVRPSVRPHGITGLPRDGFSKKFIWEHSSKICRENSSAIKIWQDHPVLQMTADRYKLTVITGLILTIRNISGKISRKKHTLCIQQVSWKSCCGKSVTDGRNTDDNTAHAHYMVDT